MKIPVFQSWSAEKCARTVFFFLAALILTVFAAFYLVAYERPFAEAPAFNAPLLTGVLLVFLGLMLAGTIVITAWSVVRTIRHRTPSDTHAGRMAGGRLAAVVAAITAVLLLTAFALSSAAPMSVNGTAYTDGFWLKIAGMFVGTSTVMMALGLTAIAAGYLHSKRLRK